ncbi:MAG: 7-cyano-7-deazaguanine synthase QueC [Verrucomicrobiota bacterium]|nr:7-cyano-7-deazaguanine synthase QueC [Verrucomicrobiota bacterium]
MTDGRRVQSDRQTGLMDRAVVLLSGGADSATLLRHVVKDMGVSTVLALTFAYGQRHAREIEMARWQARSAGAAEHRVVDFSVYGGLVAGSSVLTDSGSRAPDLADIPAEQRAQPATYVPNRNMVLLALAAAYAEARGVRDIFYGAQAQDAYGYWDCSVEFVRRLNAALALNRGNPVRVHAPFAGLRKAEVLRIGLRLGVDYDHTWTCYRGGAQACGACPSCVEREAAFHEVVGKGTVNGP